MKWSLFVLFVALLVVFLSRECVERENLSKEVVSRRDERLRGSPWLFAGGAIFAFLKGIPRSRAMEGITHEDIVEYLRSVKRKSGSLSVSRHSSMSVDENMSQQTDDGQKEKGRKKLKFTTPEPGPRDDYEDIHHLVYDPDFKLLNPEANSSCEEPEDRKWNAKTYTLPYRIQINPVDEWTSTMRQSRELLKQHRSKTSFHTGLWYPHRGHGYWPSEMLCVNNMLGSSRHYETDGIPGELGPPPPICRLSYVALPLNPEEYQQAPPENLDQILKPCVSSYLYCQFDMDEEVLKRSFTKRLKQLGIKALGILRFHWLDLHDDRYVKSIETIASLGITRHISLMNFPLQNIKKVIDSLGKKSKVRSTTLQMSILDQRSLAKIMPYCRKHGLTIQAYGCLAGGLLSDYWLGHTEPKDIEDDDTAKLGSYSSMVEAWGSWNLFQDLLRTLRKIADKHKVNIALVSLRWVIQQETVSGVIDDLDQLPREMDLLNKGQPGRDESMIPNPMFSDNLTESVEYQLKMIEELGKTGNLHYKKPNLSEDLDMNRVIEPRALRKHAREVRFYSKPYERPTPEAALGSMRDFHERLMSFKLDEDDMNSIKEVTRRGNDLKPHMGDCGEEFRPIGEEQIADEDNVFD